MLAYIKDYKLDLKINHTKIIQILKLLKIFSNYLIKIIINQNHTSAIAHTSKLTTGFKLVLKTPYIY